VVMAGKPDVFGFPLPTPRSFCVLLQNNVDSLYGFDAGSLLPWDLLALHSRWWIDWSATYLEGEGLLADRHAYVSSLASRAAFVGLPELDTRARIDAADVRQRWGIPRDQPVVVLLPFPQGVGRNAFWPRRIYGEPSRLRQLANVIAYRRFEYLPDVWHGWNDHNVVKALRAFCDRSGAYLLVKSRQKTPVPAYTEALADRCVYDERHYPATVLEALSIASLSVSYLSNSVFESAGLGVPNLCLTYRAEDYNGQPLNHFSHYYAATEGGPFQFDGVSTAWSIRETLERLPARTLTDFAMDPDARSRYLDKFLTADAGAGARTMAAIEQALGRAGRPAREASA
jgi:hypothetical protein